MRSLSGVTVMDKLRNRVIRERCGAEEDVLTKIDKDMLSSTKQIYKVTVNGQVDKARPRESHDQIEDVLKVGQVKSSFNRGACKH